MAGLPAFAQERKIWRIGFLGAARADTPVWARRVEAFRAGLRELGYVEGKNIAIEFRWAEGSAERLPSLAAELVRLKVDVIVTATTPGGFAAKGATRTIPIVLASVGDPVSTGLVASLARPAANITGSAMFTADETVKRLELLKDALPRTRRVAVLVNPGNPLWKPAVDRVMRVAATLRLEAQVVEVRSTAEFESVFDAMAEKRPDAVVIVEDSLFTGEIRKLAALTTRHRLPSIGHLPFVEAGGLIGNGANQLALFRRAAVFVDKIIRGAKAEDLPIEQAARFELVVNLKTAQALGLTLPKHFLFRADRLIE
jgi:putative ABC transport system substrate-binding protein